MKHVYSKGEYPKMRELLYLKCTNTQMFIPKYIMDMTSKIPKHNEEDIIIARIPKDYTQRTLGIIPKICKTP